MARNYSLVADTVFKNRSFDDLLKPLAMYTQEYNTLEDAVGELETKASVWDGMADEQRDPVAYAQYKRYADDLQQQAVLLAQNGLNPMTKRQMLNMKRRYSAEITPIEQAYTAMEEERKTRRNSKDGSMLYAVDNLTLDDFLGGKTPNLYNVSGNELYAKGAAIGKGFSSRVYGKPEDGGKTLGGYYRDYVQKMGYNPALLNKFQHEMLLNGFARQVSVLPELQEAAQSVLDANGVTENLTGNNLTKAQQQVIRGIVDSAIYTEDHKPVRDEGVMSAGAAAQIALQRENRDFDRQTSGWVRENGKWTYHPELDQQTKAAVDSAAAIAAAKKGATGGGTGGNRSNRLSQSSERVVISWNSKHPENSAEDARDYSTASPGKDVTEHVGQIYTYEELPEYAQELVRKRVGDGDINLYDYYFSDYSDNFFLKGDDKPMLEIVPRGVRIYNNAGGFPDIFSLDTDDEEDE